MRRSCTGSNSRRGASRRSLGILGVVLVLAGTLAVPRAEAQTLKLRALRFPATTVVGPWVTYRVVTRNRARAGREYTQRVAVVARDTYLGTEGFWVELKTQGLPSGTKIERGFFSLGDEGSSRLLRYQVYTSGGKLYEYPVRDGVEARAGSDVSTLELFEYDPAVPPTVDQMGPDTLRLGRRVVPTYMERVRRYGSDAWPSPDDPNEVQRPVLTQTYWKNPAVPITGFARSVFEVTVEAGSESAPVDSAASGTAPPDSAGGSAASDSSAGARVSPDSTSAATGSSPAPPSTPPRAVRAPNIIYRTELLLVDLGADAVPEVTAEPEMASEDESPPLEGPIH